MPMLMAFLQTCKVFWCKSLLQVDVDAITIYGFKKQKKKIVEEKGTEGC